MAGTHSQSPRCAALEGEVGEATRCTIYADRPTPCRTFTRDGEAGVDNDSCTRARARYGLAPVSV